MQIVADMQHVPSQVLKIHISSSHKDLKPPGVLKHFNNVNKLKEIMRADYSYDFFGNGSIKVISTWKEVPEDVVNDLFSALMKGNEHFTERATN